MVLEYKLLYCFYLFALFLLGFIFCRVKTKPRDMKIIVLFFIIIGSLIAAFRPENTQDTEVYNMAYAGCLDYIKSLDISSPLSIFANRSYYDIELFYIMIMAVFRALFPSPAMFYFVQGVVTNAVMVQGLYMLCKYINGFDLEIEDEQFFCKIIIMLYSSYQLFCGLLYMSSAIRDGLSISIAIFAIASLLLNKRKSLSIAMLIVSVFIHTTSIILIPIYLVLYLWKFSFQRKQTMLLGVLIPVLYFIKIGSLFVGTITIMVEKVLALLHIHAFSSYITLLDYQLPMREGYIIVLTCILLYLTVNLNLKSDKFKAVVYLGLLLFVLAYPIPALARILYVFILFLIPVSLITTLVDKYIYFLWGLFFIPQYVYVFSYLQ